MRIVSLLPSTTEIVFALGLAEELVAVTHECDYPPAARALPVITASALAHTGADSAAIDAAVRAQLRDDLSIYRLDQALLSELHPDLILTQALCEVCAVSFGMVQQAVRGAEREPMVLSLEPTSLEGILGSILAVGAHTQRRAEAQSLVAALRERVAAVQATVAQASYRPRVACLEWLDPLFGPGHWLPELVTLAGGTVGLGIAGEPSQRISWEALVAFAPEVIILTPCGFDIERTLAEAEAILPQRAEWADLPAVRDGRVYAVDGNAYFSRPGPRIVESLELLAGLLHPALFSLSTDAFRPFRWPVSAIVDNRATYVTY